MVDDLSSYRKHLERLSGEVSNLREVVSSSLDLQNRLMSCDSSSTSPQLNVDFVTGNLDTGELFGVRSDLMLGRECMSLGAFPAGLSFFHDANEKVVTSRSKFGFLPKIVRSSFSTSDTTIKEESGGFPFRRKAQG
jgi:hypothetical protein